MYILCICICLQSESLIGIVNLIEALYEVCMHMYVHMYIRIQKYAYVTMLHIIYVDIYKFFIVTFYCKRNFSMTQSIRRSVGRSVGRLIGRWSARHIFLTGWEVTLPRYIRSTR